MNTKLVMTISALFLALIGVALTFMPQEVLVLLGAGSSMVWQLVIQIMGSLYFGFAILNWMSRWSTIGGIYNRPVALANMSHYFVGGLALVKAVIRDTQLPQYVWVMAGLYAVFAIIFGVVSFTQPVARNIVSAADAN
jgi:hypothetical protein